MPKISSASKIQKDGKVFLQVRTDPETLKEIKIFAIRHDLSYQDVLNRILKIGFGTLVGEKK